MMNRTMAIHELLTLQQGTRSWSYFMQELEKESKILNFDKKRYTTEEAIKNAAVFWHEHRCAKWESTC